MPRVSTKVGNVKKVHVPRVTGRGAYHAEKSREYYDKMKKYRARSRAAKAAPEQEMTFGESAGKLLGGLAQKAIKAITGFGEYQTPSFPIESNVLIEHGDPPKVQNNGKEFIVRHREYLGDIYSGVAGSAGNAAPTPFSLQSYAINPGLAATFPWMANLGARFEQYVIEGMLFEYKSMYSDAAVQIGGSLGSVIMATEYNASKPVFVSKIEMENYEFAQSSKPSCSMIHPIECAKNQAVLEEQYIRTAALLSNEDVKMYDFGNFQIASQGIPCTGQAVSLGELWVTYQIKLLKPRISSYVDSGYARLTATVATQPSGGFVFDPIANWSTKTDNIGIKLTGTQTFTVPLLPSTRMYQVLLEVGDPANSTIQNAAVTYEPNTSIGVGNGSVVTASGLPNPAFTKTSGSVIMSGASYLFYLQTNPLAPGQTLCTVTLPPGLGAGLSYIKNLIINAVPLIP